MQSYLGRMISTALPRSSSSRASPKVTSPSPPTLATGASSGVIITTNIGLTGRGGAVGGGALSTFGSGSLSTGSFFTICASEIFLSGVGPGAAAVGAVFFISTPAVAGVLTTMGAAG